MRLSVETWPKTRDLTLRATVQAETGIGTADNAFLDRLIREATDAIERITARSFARTQWKVALHGSGQQTIRVPRFPVLRIDALTYDGAAADHTAVEIVDAEKGILYIESGWPISVRTDLGWAREERLAWEITFVAGYLLPGDDVSGVATLSADATDDSFNDSASAIPRLLVAGDWIEASGFATAAQNTRHRVTGTPTAAKVATTSALTTEAAGGSRSLLVRNLPQELERAAVEWVKAQFYARRRDSSVSTEAIDGVSASYKTFSSTGDESLEARIRNMLAPWIVRPPGLRSHELVRA